MEGYKIGSGSTSLSLYGEWWYRTGIGNNNDDDDDEAVHGGQNVDNRSWPKRNQDTVNASES